MALPRQELVDGGFGGDLASLNSLLQVGPAVGNAGT